MQKHDSSKTDGAQFASLVNLRNKIKGLYWGGFQVGWTPKKSEAEKMSISEALRLTKRMTYLKIER